MVGPLQPDFTEIDAGAEIGFDGLGVAAGKDLHSVAARILVELVEFEVAVIVCRRQCDRGAVLDQLDAGALDAIDDAVSFLGERAADETLRIAPQIAIIDPRLRAKLGLHHFEILLLRQPRHIAILDFDGAHGAGRAGLIAARLGPALVEQMGVEGPGLRQLQVLVPPDVAVGAGVDELFPALGLIRVDQHDAVLALPDRAGLVRFHAGRVVAMVAHRRSIGDVDHRQLPALLLQNVDPLVTMLRHRRRIAGPVIADIFVHGGERA